jgi:hypothetical protein
MAAPTRRARPSRAVRTEPENIMNTARTRTRVVRAAVGAVVALLAALLLLPLGAPTAHAAPPEVTASENPVVIAIQAKEITLTWSLLPFSRRP